MTVVDRIDTTGENAGYYERATGEEVREHLAEAAARLERTGRVRVLTGREHLGPDSGAEQVKDLRPARCTTLLRDLPQHAGEPAVQESLERYLTTVGPAIERLRRLG